MSESEEKSIWLPEDYNTSNLKFYKLWALKSWVYYFIKSIKDDSKILFNIVKHGTDEYTATKTVDKTMKASELFRECAISFDSSREGKLKLTFYLNGDEIVLPENYIILFNDRIGEISSQDLVDYVLVINNIDAINDLKVGYWWLESILGYIDYNLPWKLLPQGLCIDFSTQVDYIETQSNLTANLMGVIRMFYDQGYIVNPSETLIKSCGLYPLPLVGDTNGLYKIKRYDERLRNIYGPGIKFIELRMLGIYTIDYKISNNLLIIYHVIKGLEHHDFGGENLMVIDDKLRFESDDYLEIIRVLNTIDDILAKPLDKTEVNIQYYDKYQEIPVSDSNNFVIYKTDDIDRPYAYSEIKILDDND